MASFNPKTLSFTKDGNTYTIRGLTSEEVTKIQNALTQHQDITGKADKDQDAAEGNFAAFDANGNPVDSGHKHGDYLTQHQDISGKLDSSLKGAANGLAELDAGGKVPSSQLPSYVDDVLEYDGISSFPETGETGKVYIDKATNITYRWSGSTYVLIGSDLALGETSSSAYRGDRGAAAYLHAVTNKGSAFASGFYKITTNEEGHVTAVTPVQKSDITGLGIPGDQFEMVILSYGNSTWQDFIDAYSNNAIVYCRASSGSDPGAGSQTRMAFMAYVNSATNPTEVEFQYYRSVNSKSQNQQVDQVFVYKLTSANGGTWTVTTREAGTKIVVGTGLSASFSNDVLTILNTHVTMTGASASSAGTGGLVPAPFAGDEGKFLKGDGTWDNVEALPVVTSSDNSKVLEVNNGEWIVGDKKINKNYNNGNYVWNSKTWEGLTNFNRDKIWTDGENIYYSNNAIQYILNKSTSTWSAKTWTGLTSFSGGNIWTDSTNIYYSDGSTQFVLDVPNSVWSAKTWEGLTNFSGNFIWSDGENIYYSDYSTNYILDKSTSTWSVKEWVGLTNFSGNFIWSDGENTYYSNGPMGNYILDKSTSTWSEKTWTGISSSALYGYNIWTDGKNIYYSKGTAQRVLDKSTSTWNTKTWNGLSSFNGQYIWADDGNIYYSYGASQYEFDYVYYDTLLLGTNGEFNAVRVDEVIPSDMIGATASEDGAEGLVPMPIAGNNNMFLKGNGTWSNVSDGLPVITYSEIDSVITDASYIPANTDIVLKDQLTEFPENDVTIISRSTDPIVYVNNVGFSGMSLRSDGSIKVGNDSINTTIYSYYSGWGNSSYKKLRFTKDLNTSNNSDSFFISNLAYIGDSDNNRLSISGLEYFWDKVDSRKVDIDQGVENAGKFLVVNSQGNVEPVTMQAWQGGSY